MKKDNNIRSEYIKNLVEDRDKLTKQLEETTKDTLKNVVEESLNKQLRHMISESDDEFEVDEVEPDDELEVDEVEPENSDEKPEDTEDGTKGSDNTTGDEEIWDELEQYKGEDGEYDLTGMNKKDVMKVLKVMDPVNDGVRIVKNDNGTITLTDDEADTEYIIDIDGSFGNETPGDETEAEFEIDIDDDENDSDDEFDITVECDTTPGDSVNEAEVELGYTDDYQEESAMDIDSNDETADPRNTYSMDKGVPTGTSKPWVGHKGDMSPYSDKVSESMGCVGCEDEVDESMTSTENSANVRGVGMTHANTNSHQKFARNGHVQSVQTRGTGEGYEPSTNESINRIKSKANEIFNENKELRNIAKSIKDKLEEAIVVNSSLGRIIQLVTENSTTLSEKKDIIKRFDNVKTINESKQLYRTIADELKKAGKLNNTSETALDGQLSESKKNQIVETTMYQSADLSATLDLMERLNKI